MRQIVILKTLVLAMALSLSGYSHAQSLDDAQATFYEGETVKTDSATFQVLEGRVIAKITPAGMTTYKFEDGILTREKGPAGLGTYNYDRNGKFESLSFEDGSILNAVYGGSGALIGLRSNIYQAVRFKTKRTFSKTEERDLSSSLTVQKAISQLSVVLTPKNESEMRCESESEEACIVEVPDDGGGGGGSFPYPRIPGGGGGGGGGSGGPSQKPPGSAPVDSPERAVCMAAAYAAWAQMDEYVCSRAPTMRDKLVCDETNMRLYNEERDYCRATYP